MANRYEAEKLRAGEAFATDFARENPNHPDLDYMNTDLAATRARVNILNALQPVAIAEQISPSAEEATVPEQRPIPTFYIRRPLEERLVLPSSDQLVVAARAELKGAWGRDFEIPTPPDALFEDLENFAERRIRGLDEVYYQPGLQLKENDKFWKEKGRVKPEQYFWQQIKDGNFPAESAMLEEGWFVGDRRAKPRYENGQQRYGEDDYMESLMAELRDAGKIQRYSGIPDISRFGASPQEIEGTILPVFAEMTGVKGKVRNRKFIEFNVRGNMAHPEYGQTNTWEWFADPAFRGSHRLIGGHSGLGGLAFVHVNLVVHRLDSTGFSPVIAYPSKAA